MKKQKLTKRSKILIIILLPLLAVILLACVGYAKYGKAIEIASAGTAVTLVILLVLLPVLLVTLGIVAMTGKKEIRVESTKTVAGETPETTTGSTAGSTAISAASETSSKVKNTSISRFSQLPAIDMKSQSLMRNDYDGNATLEGICEDFRNFSAYKLKLYYDISDIRRFISGLAVSKIIILQGMSGTGKTSLAYAFGEYLSNPSTVIPVQPMWKERTDLLGYFNEFTKRFNETDLLVKMYEALYSKDIYITVLDEMNIARIEYYFAEFLSLLELPNEEERSITVVSDQWKTDPKKMKEGKIKLPPNMWFIGTANNDDSTFSISDKVYDRAMILNLDSKCESFKAPKTDGKRISGEYFKKLADKAKKEYVVTVRNEKRLQELDKYLIEHFRITFGNRIMKQIRTYVPVYVACGGKEIEALDDILAKKVMRKLEMQNPVYVKRSADDLCVFLDETFGEDAMPLCKAYVAGLKRNA